MLRKKNLYSRPQKPFEKSRIEDENELVKKYGLKNKREIWKALAKLNYFRKRAMTLVSADSEERENLFNKLRNIGLKVEKTTDVLELNVEDLLNRRLSTIVAKKGIANTTKHARQMIVHKKILVNGSLVNSPSYIVSVSDEDSIKLKEKVKPAPEPVQEENPEVTEEEKVEDSQEQNSKEEDKE